MGRLLLFFSLAATLLLLAAVIIGGSVWLENRFPSDDANRVLLPAVQHAVTKPIVNILSRQVGRYIHSRAELFYLYTGLTVPETISRFLDERVDLSQRRIHAYHLARIGSPECIAALLKVFPTAAAEHKAYMAQLIGSTGNPATKQCLLPLLDDSNPRVVLAAVRGLSAIGDDDVVARLAGLVADTQRADSIRIAAADGLGTIGTPATRTILQEAFDRTPAGDLSTQILTSLGGFDFPTVAATFQKCLATPDTPSETRVAAVEALANSSSEAVPYLLDLAGRDADEDVRASAAWAISMHQTVRDQGPSLATLAEREPDADVRRRLYEALSAQNNIPAEHLLPTIRAETDIAARVAGFNTIGRVAGRQPSSSVTETFDKEIVPELVQIATKPNSLNIQMRAVFALRQAQTATAQAALATIAKDAPPRIAMVARSGLRKTNS